MSGGGVRYEHFTTSIATDFFDLFADDKLGEGIARHVFAHTQDDSLVIKIETAAARFQNVLEWELWGEVQHFKPLARWFAPCVAISPGGHILIQKRTERVRSNELPKRVPEVFTDLKLENWGRFEGRVVCHDYGRSLAIATGLRKRLKRAEWDV